MKSDENSTEERLRVLVIDDERDHAETVAEILEVGGYESVSTPAGTFDAIRMRVLMQLDDATFWRYGTECNYLVWYAPSVGATVKEEKRSSYREKEGMEGVSVPGQHATLQLTSFSRGR